MSDIRYLLSIKELLDASDKDTLLEAAYTKLDQERLQKAKSIINEKKRAESIGAGLLLQLGVQEFGKDFTDKIKSMPENIEVVIGENEDSPIRLLTVSEVLDRLAYPIAIEYCYGANGKPKFRNYPWHFNLSHSEDYVFCVFSEQEVGVDIQYRRSFYNERILRRFFTKAEQELWSGLATPEDREAFFYRMWIRKESYGKLTGEGIAKAVSVNVTEPDEIAKLGVLWEHYDVVPKYQMAVCKGLREKE